MLGPYHKLRNFLERKYYTWRARRICARVGVGLRVNHRSAFTPKTEIGDYCNFNGMIIGGNGRVVIGSHFHSGTGCQMITSNHNYDHGTQIPYDSTYIDKDIIIGDQVWLGNNVVLLGGAEIGEGAIIQAGSVVVGKIPPCAIAGGHPAKVFAMRDEEHYYELKRLGRLN